MNLDLFFVIVAHAAVLFTLFLIYPILINQKKSSYKAYKRQ